MIVCIGQCPIQYQFRFEPTDGCAKKNDRLLICEVYGPQIDHTTTVEIFHKPSLDKQPCVPMQKENNAYSMGKVTSSTCRKPNGHYFCQIKHGNSSTACFFLTCSYEQELCTKRCMQQISDGGHACEV